MANILLIDSYDSYTYNLYQLLLDALPSAEIIVIRNDQLAEDDLDDLVHDFDFIVIGPGPGDPRNSGDVGFLPRLFSYQIPILGVCLGFQLLCLYGGGSIQRMKTVKHGQVSELLTRNCPLYPDGKPLVVTRYHSLCGIVTDASELDEVAWVEDILDNGHLAMSVIHKTKPFIGVQYHPESACSERGLELILNFVQIATDWNVSKRTTTNRVLSTALKQLSIRPKALAPRLESRTQAVEWRELDFLLPVSYVAELLDVRNDGAFILLDAAAEPSRYSIIASLSGTEKHLKYRVGHDSWTFGDDTIDKSQYETVWHFIAAIMEKHKVSKGPTDVPFWGGFTGYLSYESGMESLSVEPCEQATDVEDINMIFVDRCVVFDQRKKKIYIQSIKAAVAEEGISDTVWIDTLYGRLSEALRTPPVTPPIQPIGEPCEVLYPEKTTYLRNVILAQQFLAEGQSYELCLTTPTRITCTSRSSWDTYQALRSRNPSPYAGFMRLDGVTLLSSSPERFLSWNKDGLCQLRPIKGTVRKQHGIDLFRATEILKDPKEVAENLMIVDLIRHDLHQIATNVAVPQLMQVEEYHTVFQLVSVITGQVNAPHSGFDVLSRSLPPGSMTGAPKKRSVELLQKLERRRRGIYSGVCGYLSVCGGGDWSVIIRSAFKYDTENSDASPNDVWWIGAGGAITALSEPESEWEEMLTKLDSTLPCFGDGKPSG